MADDDGDFFPQLGATVLEGGGTAFRVWAPVAERSVELVYTTPDGKEQAAEMTRGGSDVWEVTVEDAPEGSGYAFRIDGDPDRTWPDPLAFEELRPGDVDGPSKVVALRPPPGDDDWDGITAEALARGVMEVHAGTEGLRGTSGGGFDDLAPRLDELAGLGLAGVEVMPVAVAAGAFDWGYNGIDPGSARSDWGGWEGLVRLVGAAHARGLAIGLDVVGNHVGPDGGYIHAYGPFAAGQAPWGDFPDFELTAVREWWLQSIERLAHTGVDFFRLDAVQGMYYDREPKRPHILIETGERLDRLYRDGIIPHRPLLVVEAGTEWLCANKDWLLRPVAEGGAGAAGFWDDELRHALFLWGFQIEPDERALANLGFPGYFARVAKLIRADEARQPGDGEPPATGPRVTAGEVAMRIEQPTVPGDGLPPGARWRCWRNHDQTGNNLLGLDSGLQGLIVRLTRRGLTAAQAQAVCEAVIGGATGATDLAGLLGGDRELAEGVAEDVSRSEELDRALLAFIWSAPGTPYDFDHSQFPYAHSSSDQDVIDNTVKGRAEEFGFDDLADDDDTAFTMPLPHDPATFELARRSVRDTDQGRARLLADLAARRDPGVVAELATTAAGIGDEGILVRFGEGASARLIACNRDDGPIEAELATVEAEGTWRVLLATSDPAYGGRGGVAEVAGGVLKIPPRTLVQLLPAQG
jgi:hypothetical protein